LCYFPVDFFQETSFYSVTAWVYFASSNYHL
jgi:hypothetical protein